MALFRLDWRTFAFGILTCGLALGCSDDENPPPQPSGFALQFVATDDGREVGCDDTIEGLGPDEQHQVALADLRFYVSNLQLWDADDNEVALELDEGDFTYASDAGTVSLVDLTGTDSGSCAGNAIAFAEGTARTSSTIAGTTLVEKVRAVSFDVGVPQAVMKEVIADHSAEGAPSPLNEMQWTWATGYRHFVLNFSVEDGQGEAGEGYVHIGSRDCGPADGLALEDRDECDFVNTPQVVLEDFDLGTGKVGVDLRGLLSGIDFVSPIYDLETFEVIGEGPGVECHSSPMQPDCATLFETFGLDAENGAADAARNVAFDSVD
jgi:uncharacterized repeat protein (TIGR04052 family)